MSDDDLFLICEVFALVGGIGIGILMCAWGQRIQARKVAAAASAGAGAPQVPPRPVRLTASASVRIDRPAADVWAFVEAPESALLTNPDGQHAARLPGTGPGLGEIPVFVGHGDDGATISGLVVTEHEPGVRASYEVIGGECRSGGSVELSGPDEGPAALEQSAWVEVQVTTGTPDAALESIRTTLRDALEKSLATTKRLLESGVRAPGTLDDGVSVPAGRTPV